ncbi:MAG: tRNA (adenosine(37)-N6)-threonylcarbamoyltransferase complex transferase subunit TsaD [Oscillospiraceae bacterium]|jgi:N6-L-threonylcarbamoyladenine synthase|nr:tRNA (adenosine(37)-N6)-threonylcarbamoyltransferase complex transferase subunit TsaD [Oscillospiraceae bacterium]
MKILAIETSCDETAAAVVADGRGVLSSIVASQVKDHEVYGGVVPEIASRKHVEMIVQVVQTALKKADLSFGDLDAIAVTHAPGLIGSLLVGVNFAKGAAFANDLPLVAVHHLRSHIAANYLTHKDLTPPFLCLIVSGGHSHIVEVLDYTKLKVIGKTKDDAAGEVFDKVARARGLPYPGGVHVDKIAENGDPQAFLLPRPSVKGSLYDFSFSGLKTAAVNLIHNAHQKGEMIKIEDLCASLRHAIVDCLTSKFLAAAKDNNYKKLAISGGVSANSHLREHLKSECEKNSLKLYMPQLSLCGDNAAMVGSQGYYEYIAGKRASLDLNASATMSIEE